MSLVFQERPVYEKTHASYLNHIHRLGFRVLASIHAPKADNCNRFLSQCDAIPGAFLAWFNTLVSTFFRRVVNSQY